MIDLTHDGLNTSVSVEESNFLEKFIDSDVPEVGGKNKSVASSLHGRQDSSHKTKSISEQNKENRSPGTDHRRNSPVYGKLISRLSKVYLHDLLKLKLIARLSIEFCSCSYTAQRSESE